MTPYEINLLLHIYSHADDHPDERYRPPVYATTIHAFLSEKLIDTHAEAPPPGCTQSKYRITPRGKAYVEYGLMRVPLPIREWRIPEPNQWAEAIQCGDGER